MKGHERKMSLFKRYAALFFAAMLLLAAGIAFTLLYFSSEKFVAYEQQTVKNAATHAVNDIENQFQAFRDVAHQLRASSIYRPGVLRSDPYRDIELLTDFTRFRNYSPLISRYFLIYQGSDKVYTSDGTIAYYSYYARPALDMDAQEAEELQHLLDQLDQEQIIASGAQNIFLFPIRFTNISDGQEKAVLGFIVSQQEFAARMERVSEILPEELSLRINGAVVLGSEADFALDESGHFGKDDRQETVVCSQNGIVVCHVKMAIERWPLLLSLVPSWLYISILLILMLLFALSLLLARASVLPLRRLLNRHPSPDQFENEFVQLDAMVSRMEEENQNSARLLRNRTLMTILRGYYSERLVERWGFLHLEFNRSRYCVAVSDDHGISSETVGQAEQRFVGTGLQDACVYLCHSVPDGILAVIIGYEDETEKQRLLKTLQEVLPLTLTVGHEVTSPERLSTSYMDALTLHHQAQGQDAVDVHHFIMRLVAAAEAGDAEMVHEECRKTAERFGQPSAQITKRFLIDVSRELETIAVGKHITLEREQLDNLGLLSDLHLALADLADITLKAFGSDAKPADRRMEAQTAEIMRYVQDNVSDPDFDLGTAGAHFSLSNDYISSLLKAATGMPFKEYLTHLRMQRACELLREHPEMTVTEVSSFVGYRKVSNFIKKFKDIHGITPSQYR